jgi:hypothetical protein
LGEGFWQLAAGKLFPNNQICESVAKMPDASCQEPEAVLESKILIFAKAKTGNA